MTLPPDNQKEREKREQEKFAYISEVSFQSWESQGNL